MPKNSPEDPLDLTETRNAALIRGGLRSVIAAAPIVGGALAQAWSEYETYKQSERVEQFFEQLTKKLSCIEKQVSGLTERIAQLPDAAELLEEVVEGVKRETQQQKRDWYVNALTYFICEPTETTRDDRRSILEDIDVLTAQDFGYLLKFKNGALRGDWLTDSHNAGWSNVGAPGTAEDAKWDKILGPAVNSLAKLESRGLIVQTAINALFGWSGDADAWYNRFRSKAWRLTPIGVKLLNAVRGSV